MNDCLYYKNLEDNEKKEIKESILDVSATLLLHVWEEVFSLFLGYLHKSPTSRFKKLLSLFVRKEYQKDRGNLSHIYLIVELA